MAPPVRPRLLRIKDSVRHTAFVPSFFFSFFPPDLSGWNIIFFIWLHSEWQFLKTAAQRAIFMTFCAAAWESRQLSISFISHLFHSLTRCLFLLYFLPALSLSLLANIFFTLLCYDLPARIAAVRLIHTLRFTENNIAAQDFPRS